MKRIICLVLAFLLSLSCLSVSCADPQLLSIGEWLDCKGDVEGVLVVYVVQMINPVLAEIADDTASAHLFGLLVDGNFTALTDAGIQTGDVLVLLNPRYNEFEGSIEMADSVLLKKISTSRLSENVYDFTASQMEELTVSDRVFDGDVTVSGEGQPVTFTNCEFHGNLICTSPASLDIWIQSDCTFAEGCRCVLQSGVREASADYPFPKFCLYAPVDVECTDAGGVLAWGTFDINLNGTVYSAADVAYYQAEDGNIVPYADGMQVDGHAVMRWFENDTEAVLTMGGK